MQYLGRLLAAERQARGTRTGTRALTCSYRALLGRHLTSTEIGDLTATIDLDNFKSNQRHLGQAVGDPALRSVARAMREVVRETDVAARLGGDEFVVLLRSDMRGATRVAEAVSTRVAAATDVPGGAPTRSIGVAVLPDNADTVDGLVAASDAALYEAKVHGRNRYACARPADRGPLADHAR